MAGESCMASGFGVQCTGRFPSAWFAALDIRASRSSAIRRCEGSTRGAAGIRGSTNGRARIVMAGPAGPGCRRVPPHAGGVARGRYRPLQCLENGGERDPYPGQGPARRSPNARLALLPARRAEAAGITAAGQRAGSERGSVRACPRAVVARLSAPLPATRCCLAGRGARVGPWRAPSRRAPGRRRVR